MSKKPAPPDRSKVGSDVRLEGDSGAAEVDSVAPFGVESDVPLAVEPDPPPEVAIVVAAGFVPERADLDAAWPGWADGRHLVVAADGGAAGAQGLGLAIDLLVGDLDSIEPARLAVFEEVGLPIEAWPTEKDATDTELAVRAALRHAPERLVLLGATGGPRLDHALANLALLGLTELAGREAVVLDAASRTRLLRGPVSASLVGRSGDLVTLLPIGEADDVTTDNLAYPLDGEALPAGTTRGVSNVRTDPIAEVRVGRGALLVIETLASAAAG